MTLSLPQHYREILVGLGEDPEREGLLDTPNRAAKAMQYLCHGYDQTLDEILNKQDVLINLTILYPAQEAVRDNDIDHALNYRTITKAIIHHVESNRFALLERLTQEVLDLVMAHDAVQYAEVEVDKPHALRFAESVSITLAAER